MSKNSVIKLTENEISDLKHRLHLLQNLNTSTLYEIKIRDLYQDNRLLCKLEAFNKLSIRFKILASTILPYNTTYAKEHIAYASSYHYYTLSLNSNLKEVPKTDLPLYVGWLWITDDFAKMLKK